MENKTFKRTTVTSALPYANGGVHIGEERINQSVRRILKLKAVIN